MHIEIYSTHNQVTDNILNGKNVIIIDVLRATSVVATALNNGALKVMTSSSIEEAFAKKEKDPSLILGGERNAKKIKGFDFGNSPLEYTSENIAKKSILLCTTNGTQAVNKAKGAKVLIAASFLNIEAVVEFLQNLNEDFSIICSGTNDNFSLDDGLCAGLLLHELREKTTVSTNDLGELIVMPFKNDTFSLIDLIQSAYHLKYLISMGYSKDVDYCLDINRLKIIPIWKKDGFIVLKEYHQFYQ